MFFDYQEKGLIALITVLIISAVILLIILSTNLLGIDVAQIGLKKYKSSQAIYLANACAEEALFQLLQDFDNISGGKLTINGETCSFSINLAQHTTRTRTILAQSQVENFVKKLNIYVLKYGERLKIIDWQEVP